MFILSWFLYHSIKVGVEQMAPRRPAKAFTYSSTHTGSLISIYPALEAEQLSQAILFPCILCFQTSTCLKCKDCALHHNNTLESAFLLSFVVVRICQASGTSYSVQALQWPVTWTTCSVSTQGERKKSTRNNKLLRKDLLLLSQ